MFIASNVPDFPVPSGAECKLSDGKYIALRWSAEPLRMAGYKHRAPLEHFALDH